MARKGGAPNVMDYATQVIFSGGAFFVFANEGVYWERFLERYFSLMMSRKNTMGWATVHASAGPKKLYRLTLFLRSTISNLGGGAALFSFPSELSPPLILPFISWVTMNLLKWRRSAFGLHIKSDDETAWVKMDETVTSHNKVHSKHWPWDNIHRLSRRLSRFALFTLEFPFFGLEELLQATFYRAFIKLGIFPDVHWEMTVHFILWPFGIKKMKI